MNILLSMPQDGQSNHYMIDALQDMGHNVIFVDHRRDIEQAAKIVPQILQHENIDIMLVLYLVPTKTYDVNYIKHLKVNFPQVKYVSWCFDATMDGLRVPENDALLEIIKEYDYFLTVCDGQVEELQSKGVNAFWVQEGATKFTAYCKDYVQNQIYDVSFIGQMGHPRIHKERVPLLRKIISRYDNTLIAGPLLSDIGEDLISHHLKRPTYTDLEHSRIVAQSKINISHSGWSDINHYFSARTYRLMANGGFVLANYSEGIEDIYNIGKEIVTYKTHDECLEKIAYYLEHEEEREDIAHAGYLKTMTDYTFHNSFKRMFEVVG